MTIDPQLGDSDEWDTHKRRIDGMTALQAAPMNTLPAKAEWEMILDMGAKLVASRMLPETIKSKEAAAAIILKGMELGIPAMQSFSHIHVIKGKPTCSAELQLSLLARGGVTWEWTKNTGEIAEIVLKRPGFAPCMASFTKTEAQTANLMIKDTWKQYTGAMLRARAISIGARMIGPDLLGGMSYTPEELGAVVDSEGEVLEISEASVIPPVDTNLTPIKTPDVLKEYAAWQDPKAGDRHGPFTVIAVPEAIEPKLELDGLHTLADAAQVDEGVHEEELPPATKIDGKGKWFDYLQWCGKTKKDIGEERYYQILKQFDIAHANELEKDDVDTQRALMLDLKAEREAMATA